MSPKKQQSGKVKSGWARPPPVVCSWPRRPCAPLSSVRTVLREQHVPPPPEPAVMNTWEAWDWFSEVCGQTEEGFPAVRPLEPGFFAYLREVPSFTESFMMELTDRTHQCAAQVAAASEGISLLASYMKDLAAQLPPGVAAEIREGSEAILELSSSMASANADIMGCQILVQRAVWLSLSTLSAQEQEHLLNGPISPDGLFGPHLQEKIKLDEQVKLQNL